MRKVSGLILLKVLVNGIEIENVLLSDSRMDKEDENPCRRRNKFPAKGREKI